MYDLICDIISYCVWSCKIGKINEYDKIVMKNKKKKENMEIEEISTKISIQKKDFGMEFTAC